MRAPPGASSQADGRQARGLSFEAVRACDAVIVLPTLNEEKGLARTLGEIPFDAIQRHGWTVRPLLIDGGSTDRTLEVARRYGVPVLRQTSKGKGAAVREALEWLRQAGVPFVVVLDADATYPGAAVLPALELLRFGSDLIIGVRQAKQQTSLASSPIRDLVHRAGNALLNLSAELLSGCSLLDICSGFWAVRVSKVPELGLRSTDFAIEAELFLKARRAAWTVHQFPILYKERVGQAKLHAVRDGLRILGAIVRFGRQSVGVVTDPIVQRMSHLLRTLTLVLLIEGPRDVVLMSSAEVHGVAQTIAKRLRRGNLATRVTIGTGPALRPSGELAPAAVAPSGERTSLIISRWDEWDRFDPSESASKSPVALRFPHDRSQIYVDLTPTRGNGRHDATEVAARSGGFLETFDRRLPRFVRPIHLLADQLRNLPTPTNFLRANGIRVEQIEERHAARYSVAQGVLAASAHRPGAGTPSSPSYAAWVYRDGRFPGTIGAAGDALSAAVTPEPGPYDGGIGSPSWESGGPSRIDGGTPEERRGEIPSISVTSRPATDLPADRFLPVPVHRPARRPAGLDASAPPYPSWNELRARGGATVPGALDGPVLTVHAIFPSWLSRPTRAENTTPAPTVPRARPSSAPEPRPPVSPAPHLLWAYGIRDGRIETSSLGWGRSTTRSVSLPGEAEPPARPGPVPRAVAHLDSLHRTVPGRGSA